MTKHFCAKDVRRETKLGHNLSSQTWHDLLLPTSANKRMQGIFAVNI